MAWPKLRSSHSGGAQDGARSHTGVPESAPGDSPGSAPEVAPAGSDTGDLPLWDWARTGSLDDLQDEPAEAAGPPRPEWNKPVVTPVEEAGTEPRPSGIGERRGNLAHLSANPRMRVWQLRAVVAIIVLVAFSILVSWQFGLTLAVIVVIADTIYRSRRGSAGQVRLTGAQRRTRRQLAKLGRAGYRAMHAGRLDDRAVGREVAVEHGQPAVGAQQGARARHVPAVRDRTGPKRRHSYRSPLSAC